MKKNYSIFILLALFVWFPVALPAQSAAEVRDRMEKRLPEVDEMKKNGIVGENNKGYLEARQKVTNHQEGIIKAENADRKYVYTVIASRSNATPEFVGQQRAKQVAAKSARGLWLQNEKGEWYRK